MEERVKKVERRIKTVEEAILILSEKMHIHDDWWDEHRAFQADTEVKIAALVNAQIKNEDDVLELRSKVLTLIDAQIENEKVNKAYKESTKKLHSALLKILKGMDDRIKEIEKKNGNGKNGKKK